MDNKESFFAQACYVILFGISTFLRALILCNTFQMLVGFEMFKSLLLLYIFIILANAILVIYSSVKHKILRSVWRGFVRFPRKEMIAPKADDLLSQVLQNPVIVLSLNINFVVNLVVYCSLNRFRIL